MLNRPLSSLLFRPAELFGLILDDVSEKEESGGEPIKNLCIVAAARKKAGLGETSCVFCLRRGWCWVVVLVLFDTMELI